MVGALSLVLSLASNVSPQERASDPSRAAFMKAHFSEAIVMHDAVARGDLPAAHAQATRLAQHRPAVPFPTGAHVFFGLMTIDAGKVRSANTVEEAGHAASSLLSRCGECHRPCTLPVRSRRHQTSGSMASWGKCLRINARRTCCWKV